MTTPITLTSALSIPLSSTHPQFQQPFKLLELPPDLLTLLESRDPPILQISSHATPPHHAHLSTSGGKKYALRVKSSSNPMLLVLPLAGGAGAHARSRGGLRELGEGEGEGEDGGEGQERADQQKQKQKQNSSLTRISTVEETIELMEVKEGGGGEGEGGGDELRRLGRGNRWRERFGRGRV